MPQLIDLRNIESKRRIRKPIKRNVSKEEPLQKVDDTIRMLFSINPGKVLYSIDETARTLNMGKEFVRRRLQNGEIKCVYFGDRQMITIYEIARIINNGV